MIGAAIRKDLALLRADRGALLSLFALPVVFIAVFGAMFDRPGAAGPSGFQVAIPGNAVLFGFFVALTVGLSFAVDRRSGVFRRVLAAPVSRGALLAAKLVPGVLIGAAQMTLLFGLGVAVFGLRIEGSPLALALVALAVVVCASCLGLLIASLAGTERQIGGIGSICLLVLGLLGGAMIPRIAMTPTMRAVGLATPHGWALDGYYAALHHAGTGVVDVLPQVGALLGFAAGFALVGIARFDFERT